MVDREDKSRLTSTFRNMVVSGAGSSATVDQGTGVYAPVVGHLAHLVSAAVGVGLTFYLGTSQGSAGVSNMLLQTSTEGFMILNLAVGVVSAL